MHRGGPESGPAKPGARSPEGGGVLGGPAVRRLRERVGGDRPGRRLAPRTGRPLQADLGEDRRRHGGSATRRAVTR
ncbi:hypothetical protein B1K54_13240 [Streptomyces sp. fd1-xmd]|nr:hypothetical protein B1K54_13240 [Streptomyces sp. fd1-xmd]